MRRSGAVDPPADTDTEEGFATRGPRARLDPTLVASWAFLGIATTLGLLAFVLDVADLEGAPSALALDALAFAVLALAVRRDR